MVGWGLDRQGTWPDEGMMGWHTGSELTISRHRGNFDDSRHFFTPQCTFTIKNRFSTSKS